MKKIMRSLAALCAVFLLWSIPVRGAEEKYVAMTFDDGPSGRFTRRLLTGLEERDAKATFFLCGYRLEQYSTIAGEILDGGHEIGLHGYSHKNMADMSREQLEQELNQTAQLLREQTGTVSCLLRPPGGVANQTVTQTARQQGLSLINWSVDPKDWATGDSRAVVQQVLANTQDGDIILLHDMSDSSVDAALEIVDRLQAEGYVFVTVSQLAQLRGKTMEAGGLYTSFHPAYEVDAGES